MSTVRRLYFYVVSFVALLATSFGATSLIGAGLSMLLREAVLAGDRRTQVASAIATLAVAVPVWLLHWYAVQRQARTDPQERQAALRHLYLNAILFIAAAVLFFNLLPVVQWLLGTREPASSPLQHMPMLLVWSSLWAYHWWVLRGDRVEARAARTLHRWYVYPTALYSLVAFAIGLGATLQRALEMLYDAMFRTTLTIGPLWSDAQRSLVALIMVGGLWWAFHWTYAARGDTASVLRQVYLYLVFTASLATLFVTAGTTLYATLRYLFDPTRLTPATHFDFLPDALPVFLIALLLVLYHWQVLEQEAPARPVGARGVQRSYRYLVTAFALLTFATGTAILLTLLLGLLTSPTTLTPRWWRDPLAASLALLVLGAPLWTYQWLQAQAEARAGGVGERRALPRRLLIYGVLAVGLLALLGNLTYIIFRFLDVLLTGSLSTRLIFDVRGNVAAALVALVAIGYHVTVMREDIRIGAETALRRKQLLLLIGDQHRELVAEMRDALPGSQIQVLEAVPTPDRPTSFPLSQLREALSYAAGLPGDRALVVVSGDTVHIYPYR